MKRTLSLGLIVLALAPVGCRHLSLPWWNPGPADLQEVRAVRFNPYPENNVGPDTVSMRPPGFEHERAEVERSDRRRKPQDWTAR